MTVAFDASFGHLRTVVFPVDAHYQSVLHQTIEVLLKGLWLVLRESYLDVSTMKPLQIPIIYLYFRIHLFSTSKS